MQAVHEHRERHDVAELHRVHDEDHEQHERVPLVREERGRDERLGGCERVPRNTAIAATAAEVQPLERLQEHDDAARGHCDEEQAEDVEARRAGLFVGHRLEHDRQRQGESSATRNSTGHAT